MNAIVAAVVLVLAGFITRPAQAQTCSVSSPGVSFGTYNTLSASATNTVGTVTVSCTSSSAVNVSYTVQLGAGQAGNFSGRALSGGASALHYQLYSDALRSQIWGDGTGGTTAVTDSYLLSSTTVQRSYSVYAGMPARQNVTAGTYSDSVLITVVY